MIGVELPEHLRGSRQKEHGVSLDELISAIPRLWRNIYTHNVEPSTLVTFRRPASAAEQIKQPWFVHRRVESPLNICIPSCAPRLQISMDEPQFPKTLHAVGCYLDTDVAHLRHVSTGLGSITKRLENFG